jgi:hypothetical protein
MWFMSLTQGQALEMHRQQPLAHVRHQDAMQQAWQRTTAWHAQPPKQTQHACKEMHNCPDHMRHASRPRKLPMYSEHLSPPFANPY